MNFSKALIVTTLLVLALPSITQAEEPETADTQTPGPAQSSPESAVSRNEQSAESASEAAAPTEPSPYDYESTEQISEDRSVSFPVDI